MPFKDPEVRRAYDAVYNAAHREERRSYHAVYDVDYYYRVGYLRRLNRRADRALAKLEVSP